MMPLKCRLSFVFSLLILLSSCEDDFPTDVDPYSAVPQNVAAVVEFHDIISEWPEFASSNIYRELDSLPAILSLSNQLKSMKGLMPQDSLEAFFENRPLLMAVALSGAEKYDVIFLTIGDPEFEKSFGRQLQKSYSISKKTYSGASIFNFSNDQHSYFVSGYKGMFMLSKNRNLVEECIRQLNSEFSLAQEAQFKRLRETANTKDAANIYVNPQEAQPLVQNLLPKAEADFMSRLVGWSELDLQFTESELFMSGLSLLPEQDAFYLQCFKGLDGQRAEAAKVIPAGAGMWLSLNFANAERYYRQYRDYLKEAGRLRKHQQLVEKIAPDPEASLLSWVDQEMGLVAINSKASTHHLAYLSYRSEANAGKNLDSISTDFIEGYRGVVIKKLSAENALPRFYGPLFSEFHHPYYILKNGYAIFAENLPALKGVVNDIVDGKTLTSDKEFLAFRDNLPAESHLQTILINPNALGLMGGLLSQEKAAVLESRKEDLANIRWAAFQFNVEDEAALSNFYLEHAPRQKELVTRSWSTQLQSEAANVPQFLKNHVNNRCDIAVQDEDNRLYLLDYNGKILWTKMLDGPIMGDITQVDAYKNRKLQMVFNTRDKLYLVDRLGRDVESFPVELPEAATAPVGVFNYDNARNYRLVVPSGQDLLNYDIEGKVVYGWAFEPAGSEIITKPQHFSVSGKDIIVVETAEGKLLQLNRRGEQRFETIDGLPKLDIPFYLKSAETLAKSEMLSTGDDGKLYAFHPGGTADNLFLEEDHPAEHFLYFDDKYIFSSDEMLFVKSDGRPWQAELNGDISSKPKAMIFKGDFYVGAFSEEAEKISLFNKEGQLVAGFPVFAQGPFDMGSLKADGNINIVTYSEDGTLICYRVE